MAATVPVIIVEMTKENRNGCRRAKLRGHEKTEGGGGFFSRADCNPSGSSWVGKWVRGVVWSALDISRVRSGLGGVVYYRVYWSSVERKEARSLVGSRTSEMTMAIRS